MKIIFTIIIFWWASNLLCTVIPIDEDFESDIEALKKRGWFIPENAYFDSTCSFDGNKSIKITVSEKSKHKYISYYVPVEPNKKYVAEVWIKYENIETNNLLENNRGAIIFCQYHDEDKKWIAGGTFPFGFLGDGSWERNEVLIKNRIPDNVKYVNILLGIEGVGTAWFDNLMFREVKSNVREVKLLEDKQYQELIYKTNFIMNGEDFFPIGCYRDPDDELFNVSNIVGTGFNLTHSYDFEHGTADLEQAKKYLNLCEQHGLQVFMGIERKKIHNRDYTYISNWVHELKDYSALFTWYLYDEPELNDIKPMVLTELHEAVKSIDSLNTTSIVLSDSRRSRHYDNSYDILMIDEYPLPDNNIDLVSHKIREATELINGSKPIIAVIQAYDKNGEDKLNSGLEITHPTYSEIRCMTFLAIASGVKGIIYYWSPNYKYHIINDSPKVWEGLKRVVKELNDLKPFLLSTDKRYYKPDKLCNLEAWSSSFDGKEILVLINTAPSSLKIDIDFSEIHLKNMVYGSSDELYVNKTKILHNDFKPYEVKIFTFFK